MELRITFGLLRDELDDNGKAATTLVGLSPADLTSLSDDLHGVPLSVQAGSVGKGAAAAGIDLVVHIAEQILNDGASAFGWGTALWALVHRVQRKRERRLVVQDPATIGVLAAAGRLDHEQLLRGAHLTGTVCMTGGGPGLGTDERDVWATSFVLANEDILVVFTSPSGLVLGEVMVAPERTARRGQLDSAAVADVFDRLNNRSTSP